MAKRKRRANPPRQRQVGKALAPLPPGSTTVTESEARAQGQAGSRGSSAVALGRDPQDALALFGPNSPLIPTLVNQPREDGRAQPRRYEYPVAWNVQLSQSKLVPFSLLRQVADQADLARRCIEVIKASVAGMEWSIAPRPEHLAEIQRVTGGGRAEATELAMEELDPAVAKAKAFWRMPDRVNGMTFADWLGVLLEEMLVVDALSISPTMTMDDRDLHSLVILDGATVKPLLDPFGNRPMPPYPAYQQVLYAFPRGEFTASHDPEGEFTADDLVYAPRWRRVNTPYGYSPTERALPLLDLYMKRQAWLRAEFTDGVMPELLIKSDANYGGNAELLRAYEDVFNDALSGQTQQRKRMKILPVGMDPMTLDGWEYKYQSAFDEQMVKDVCGHYGVLPSQIGFVQAGGLGGAGHQQGEASSHERQGLMPTLAWITELLNDLSQRFLQMPDVLTFTFNDGRNDDQQEDATRYQTELASAQKTVNEVRSEKGLPRFDLDVADMPLIQSGQTLVPLSDLLEQAEAVVEGLEVAEEEPMPADGAPDEEAPDEEAPGDGSAEGDAEALTELGAFVRWARKGPASRPFRFTRVDPATADTLNALVDAGDLNAARDLAVLKAGDARGRAKARVLAR